MTSTANDPALRPDTDEDTPGAQSRETATPADDTGHHHVTGTKVVRLSGDIDNYQAPKARADLLEAIGDGGGPLHLVVDLGDVTMIDAVGWGVLIGTALRLEHRGGALLLAGANQRVRNMHRVMKLGLGRSGECPPIPLYGSVEEAVRAVREDARQGLA